MKTVLSILTILLLTITSFSQTKIIAAKSQGNFSEDIETNSEDNFGYVPIHIPRTIYKKINDQLVYKYIIGPNFCPIDSAEKVQETAISDTNVLKGYIIAYNDTISCDTITSHDILLNDKLTLQEIKYLMGYTATYEGFEHETKLDENSFLFDLKGTNILYLLLFLSIAFFLKLKHKESRS